MPAVTAVGVTSMAVRSNPAAALGRPVALRPELTAPAGATLSWEPRVEPACDLFSSRPVKVTSYAREGLPIAYELLRCEQTATLFQQS